MKKERINDNWLFWKDGHETEKQLINLPHDAMLTEERVPDLPNGNAKIGRASCRERVYRLV